MRENKHLGKIAILVGAEGEGEGKTEEGPARSGRRWARDPRTSWHVNPFRGDKFAEGWAPAAEAALDFGAVSWRFYRAIDGRLDFIQDAIFPSKAHFERYWYSETIAEKRTELQATSTCRCCPSSTRSSARATRSALLQRSKREPAPAELLPVVLGQLARA